MISFFYYLKGLEIFPGGKKKKKKSQEPKWKGEENEKMKRMGGESEGIAGVGWTPTLEGISTRAAWPPHAKYLLLCLWVENGRNTTLQLTAPLKNYAHRSE